MTRVLGKYWLQMLRLRSIILEFSHLIDLSPFFFYATQIGHLHESCKIFFIQCALLIFICAIQTIIASLQVEMLDLESTSQSHNIIGIFCLLKIYIIWFSQQTPNLKPFQPYMHNMPPCSKPTSPLSLRRSRKRVNYKSKELQGLCFVLPCFVPNRTFNLLNHIAILPPNIHQL